MSKKAKIQIGTNKRKDGVYLIVRPSAELKACGWYDLEKGPYVSEAAARADSQMVIDVLVKALPNGRVHKV